MKKTTVRAHTRRVKGDRVPVVRHQRSVKESLGRVGREERPLRLRYKYTDIWNRPVYEDMNNKRTIVFVDGVPHTVTSTGEPDVPIKQAFKGGYKQEQTDSTTRSAAAQGVEPFMKTELTEREVLLMKRRINSKKITVQEALEAMPDDGWALTQEQTEKGRKWLTNQWKTPLGVERVNNPFGYREQAAIQTLRSFKLVDFYSPRGNYYYPVYRAEGTEGSFTYTVIGGDILILG